MRAIKPHITHHGGCDCFTARFEAMEEALCEILLNGGAESAEWMRKIAEEALRQPSPPPLPSPSIPDTSPSPAPQRGLPRARGR